MPEAVSQGSDGYNSVDYGKLTPLLVEALKELKAEKDAASAELETLRADLRRLEATLASLKM